MTNLKKPRSVRAVNKKPAQKPAQKPKVKAAETDEVLDTGAPAPKPTMYVHQDQGVDASVYSGISSFLNANRKVKVRVDVKRSPTDATERMQKCFYAVRKAYGGKSFPSKGLDNGIVSNLIGAGLLTFSGGTKDVDTAGNSIMRDGESPLMLKLTAAGKKYGLAA